jgi:hypothetical protein
MHKIFGSGIPDHDALEYIRGMIVTQHSRAGRANHYFLRGFNLDYGTDFNIYLAGMLVNCASTPTVELKAGPNPNSRRKGEPSATATESNWMCRGCDRRRSASV